MARSLTDPPADEVGGRPPLRLLTGAAAPDPADGGALEDRALEARRLHPAFARPAPAAPTPPPLRVVRAAAS